MRRRLTTISVGAAALAAGLSGCSDQPPADVRSLPPLVRTVVVQDTATMSRGFTGTVAARVQSDLGFRVAGKVVERLVDAGQAVRRGQPLMRIDPVDLRLAAVAQAQAVSAARAQALQTAQEEARYRDLQGTGAISASAYDRVKAAADAAKAQFAAAEAQADVVRNASRYAELLADADGVVVETLAESGQVVAAGQTVVRLAHAGRREALIQLPETLRPAVGSPAQARLYGDPQASVSARLRQLSEAADRRTRTYEARYVLEGALTQVPLGATVTVEIPDGKQSPSLQVPISALFDPGKGPGVWALEGQPAKAVWRAVQVLGLTDEAAQVKGHLKAGDQVVSLGAHLLSEGEIVRPTGQSAKVTAGDRP